METSDPQSPGPSASLVDTEETPYNKEGDPETPEPVAEEILLCIVVQPQYRSSNKQLHIRTYISTGIL
jgi:hypothetical protein